MTTISDDDIGRVRVSARQQRSSDELAGAGSRRYWMWTSTAWATSVGVTAVVATGQAITVAIGGMTLAALGNALARPEPSAAKSAPETAEVSIEPMAAGSGDKPL